MVGKTAPKVQSFEVEASHFTISLEFGKTTLKKHEHTRINMKCLTKWMRRHRVVGSDKAYNLQCLRGGKFNIPVDKRATFYKLYTAAVPEMTEEHNPSLVFKSIQGDAPFCVDIDLNTTTRQPQTVEPHLLMCEEVCKLVGECTFFIVMKPEPYQKKKHGQQVWAGGAHLYFDTVLSKEKAARLRDVLVGKVEEIYPGLLNTPDDVVDDCVVSRANGLCLAGGFKKTPGQGGRYNVVLQGYADPEGAIQVVSYDGLEAWEEGQHLMRALYDPYLRITRTPLTPKPKPVRNGVSSPSDEQCGGSATGEKDVVPRPTFQMNVKAFLRATQGWTPGNNAYQKLVIFMSHCDLNFEETAALCNAAWSPPGGQEGETLNMLRKYAGMEIAVGKEAVRRMLRDNATSHFVEDDVLPRTDTFTYYNEYKKFVHGTHLLADVERFLTDILHFVNDTKKYVWTRYRTEFDRSGREIRLETVEMSKNPPFTGSDDAFVSLLPPRDAILKALRGRLDQKMNKNEEGLYKTLLELLSTDIDTALLYKKASLFIECPPTESEKMSKIIKTLMLDHRIKRYQSLTFRPFAGKTPKVQNPHILNAFRPFALHSYTPARSVDVKTTFVWKYLWECCAGKDPGLFQYVLRMLANHLQNPHIRTERLYCWRGKTQGTGKSTWAYLLMALLGSNLVAFHDTLKSVLERFNSTNAFKLIHFVDDISSATHKETRQLYPKATERLAKYEKKGETPFRVAEYSTYYITGNDKSPLFVQFGDRRQCFLEMNSEHTQERAFFEKVYAEFGDLETMKAWFEYLRSVDLAEWHPQDTPPSKALDESIASCMCLTHRFVKDFFDKEDFVFEMLGGFILGTKNCHVLDGTGGLRGECIVRCTQTGLYRSYRGWAKDFHSTRRVQGLDRFLEELESVGVTVHKKRQRFGEQFQYKAVDIAYGSVRKAFRHRYPSEEFQTWPWVTRTDVLKKMVNS